MSKRKVILTILLTLLFLTIASYGESVYLSGYARNYTGMLLNAGNEFSIVQNTFDLKLEHSRNRVAFKANPYFYQYFDKDLKIGLREAYLDIFFNRMDSGWAGSKSSGAKPTAFSSRTLFPRKT